MRLNSQGCEIVYEIDNHHTHLLTDRLSSNFNFLTFKKKSKYYFFTESHKNRKNTIRKSKKVIYYKKNLLHCSSVCPFVCPSFRPSVTLKKNFISNNSQIKNK